MAVTLTEPELSEALVGNMARVGVLVSEASALADLDAARLLPVVSEMVDRFAPAAPAEIANEAAIRTAGYLAQQPADARQSESYNILGVQFETSHATGAVSSLRASGAMALLTPYKVRRAGKI